MELWLSIRYFFWGILKRFYYWLPFVVLDIPDLWQRYLEPFASKFGWELEMPDILTSALVIASLVWAGVLTYHELRTKKVNLGKDIGHQELSLKEQIGEFIKEGEELRRLAVSQGEPIPEANASNWRTKVDDFLDENFDLEWLNDFKTKYKGGNPKKQFAGVGMTNQIELWKKLQAGIEWLQDFQNQIKDT